MSAMPNPSLTPADVDAAAAWFRTQVPRRFHAYLTDGAPSDAAARRALDALITRVELTTRAQAEQLRAGAVSLDDWQAALALTLVRMRLVAIMLARGGVAHVTLDDLADTEL